MKNNHSLRKLGKGFLFFLLFCLMCSYTSYAQPCISPFAIDGNPAEWDDPDVTSLPFFYHVQDPFGQGVVDNAFTQGTKDFDIAWDKTWEIGQTKPKNDLCNGAAVIKTDCTTGDYLLYFAGDRSKIQGDAQIGFWLLLNGTSPVTDVAPNGQPLLNFQPEHAYGDLLILSNFTNGGRLANVEIYMWVGPGNGNAGSNLSLQLTTFTGTAAQNNDAVYGIPMGWDYPGTTYPLNAFYEGVINLTAIYEAELDVELPALCKATWLLEARSSASITAALDDFIGGPFGIEPDKPSASRTECYPGDYCLTVTPSEAGTIKWYASEEDALADTNLLHTGLSYCAYFSQTTTLYITLTNVVECTSAPGKAVMTITGGPSAADSHTDVSCNGLADGSVSIDFSGGTPPYQVSFNDGAFEAKTSPAEYNNLAQGTYNWIVKDANGCETEGSETVGEPLLLEATDAHTDVLCNGGSTGSVTITITGGTAPYYVSFNGGAYVEKASPAVYSNLAAGVYNWSVKDANDCMDSGSETITEPLLLEATDDHVDVLCNGESTGSVTITITGGTTPYYVSFDGGAYVEKASPAVYDNLAAGVYNWSVKDDNDCEASGSETVGQPQLLEVSLQPLDPQCALDVSVSIPVTITGGTPPYQVKLDDGEWVPIAGNETLLATTPGSHTVYVKDDNDCAAQDDLTIEVVEVTCEAVKLLDANCEGTGGSAIAYGYNGDVPYTFLWSNGETTQTAVDLAPGDHSVEVTDARGCLTTCYVTIEQLPCEELCTYTQGKYGNQGNSSICDGEMTYPTAEFVGMLLDQGPLELGWGANKLIFQAGDAMLIDAILPGGGTNDLISGTCFANVPACLGSYLTKQGRLKSGFISQTLTLGLNLRINEGLSSFVLQSEGLLTTQKVMCGSDTPVEMVCEPIYDDAGMLIGYNMTTNPYWYAQVNAGLLCYMAENGYDLTVGGLYLLANHALGGFATFPASVTCEDITYTISLTTIKNAVDMINNIFDECRVFVGYLDEMIACPPVLYSAPVVPEAGQSMSAKLQVNVMPNPFSVSTEITVNSLFDTKADVEVYDMTGRRVSTLFSGNLLAGSTNTYRFTTDSRGSQQSFMLVVRTDHGVIVKRIIDMK
ncbi:MAG: hypothetical protein K0B15_05680 [Lentimicrobium sp.]|nr:hypothetical protein [Lentimicrobium sp.]